MEGVGPAGLCFVQGILNHLPFILYPLGHASLHHPPNPNLGLYTLFLDSGLTELPGKSQIATQSLSIHGVVLRWCVIRGSASAL